MKMIAKLIGILSVLTLLVNCGGGGSASFTSGGGGGGGTPGSTVSTVQLLASSTQIGSAGTAKITLTAIIKDSSNVVMANVPVIFSANNSGTIEVISGTTDLSGIAQATVSTAGNKDNRTITVTATASTVSSAVDIDVIGTSITIAGATSLGSGEQATLTITLKDSAGTAISNKSLTVTGDAGLNIVSTVPVTTGSNGQATVSVVGVSGTGTLTVTGAGTATATQTIVVSATSFAFTLPTASQEVNLGATQTVTARLLDNNAAVVGQTVNFTATRGTLSAGSAVTDASGLATVTISSNNAGPCVITATTGSGSTAQVEMLFVATTPDSMTVQATPTTIGVNSGGSAATQISTITAVVRDAANNLVKNQTVNFTLTDVSGGTISPASAITDEFGRANTVYTAGASASANDGVSITAVVPGTDCPNGSPVAPCTSTVNLTVAQQALFVTLGTGNTINEPNQTTYSLPYSVLVTDASGGPVSAQVTISIIPTYYYKGVMHWNGTLYEPSYSVPAPACINEDTNLNGNFEPLIDNDVNNDGILWPGNIATFSGSAVTVSNVTTGTDGFAYVNILYPQDHAYWVSVDLNARAVVAGSESSTDAKFVLPGAASDYSSQGVAPPGFVSPYGVANTCSNPL